MTSIIQTIMLGVGPLIGIWLGSRLTRFKEDRQWRRDRCLEAYTDVIRACEIVAAEASRLYLELSDHTTQLQVLYEKISELHRASQRAILLAPKEMMATLTALITHTEKQIAVKAGISPKIPLDDWKKITTTDLAIITARFTDEARNDLGTHSPFRIVDRCRRILHRSESATGGGLGRL
jgi:hypothetical protein